MRDKNLFSGGGRFLRVLGKNSLIMVGGQGRPVVAGQAVIMGPLEIKTSEVGQVASLWFHSVRIKLLR